MVKAMGYRRDLISVVGKPQIRMTCLAWFAVLIACGSGRLGTSCHLLRMIRESCKEVCLGFEPKLRETQKKRGARPGFGADPAGRLQVNPGRPIVRYMPRGRITNVPAKRGLGAGVSGVRFATA